MIQDGPTGAVTQAGLGGGKEACGICNNTGRIRKMMGMLVMVLFCLCGFFPLYLGAIPFTAKYVFPRSPLGLICSFSA